MLQKSTTDRKPFLKRTDLKPQEKLTKKIVRSQLVDMKATQFREAGPVLVIEFEDFDKAWIPNKTSINNLIDQLGENEADWRQHWITLSRCTGFDDNDPSPDAIYAHPSLDKTATPEDYMQPMQSAPSINSGWGKGE